MKMTKVNLEKIDFEKIKGLIPAVSQDYRTNKILMIGFMSKEALEKTLKTGRATYWSRTRKKLWIKGESSGNFQIIKSVWANCDLDSILLKVEQIGNVCHDGAETCFYRKIHSFE